MKRIQNESLFDLKNIGQTVVCGGFVYFTETQINQSENTYETQLYRLDMVTKEKIAFGNGSVSYSDLQLSPQKTYLSFLSSKDKKEKTQLYLIPLSGGSAIALTQEKEGVGHYVWGQDESTIYYQTSQGPEDEKSKDTKEDWPKSRVITNVRYQLDGVGDLPVDKTYQLKCVDRVSQKAELIFEQDQSFSLVNVSHDGQKVLYNQSSAKPEDFAYGLGQVWSYDVKSQQKQALTDRVDNGNFYAVAVSPDESRALFVGNCFEHQFVSQDKLYLYDFASAEFTCLTDGLDRSVGDEIVADFQQNCPGFELAWLDDECFVFSVTDEGRVLLYQGDVQGNLVKLIDQSVHVTGGAYSDDSNQLVVSYSTTTVPSRLAILVDGQLTDLYDPNESFMAEHQVVQPEVFTYEGYAGWQVQGWYLAPVEEKDKYPAILYIHGGPQVCYGESFFHEMQVLAGQGYGVIMLNPRGGSSYGQEFVASILGDYGNHDYDDLMLGLDHVLASHPKIDQDRLYVVGGSYGGFMTNWVVGHTTRFRAACTQRCISNWLSFYGTSDIGPFFVEYQLQADIRQADKLWQMSPLAYADRVQTPLLVLHGEADKRCPQEQGEQMYMAMKKFGVPTKLITFPESSHGLSREGLPNLRLQRLKAIQDWFKQYQ